MRMTENNMVYERGAFWVYRGKIGSQRPAYIVFRPHGHSGLSEAESAYAITADGLSLAKARVDYLYCRSQSCMKRPRQGVLPAHGRPWGAWEG